MTHEVVSSWLRSGKGQRGTEEEQSGSEVELHRDYRLEMP